MTRTTIATALAALALTGCMTAEQKADNDERFRRAEEALNKTQARATITCDEANLCDKAWRLTKSYIEQNSEMRVRRADDTLIETYLPINTGMVSLQATRVEQGKGAVIKLVGLCRGMYDSDGSMGYAYSSCFTKIATIQNGLMPYLQAHT